MLIILVLFGCLFAAQCRWARRGDVWEATDLIQQMKRERVHPDIHTYTSMINACSKAGDMAVSTISKYSFLFFSFKIYYNTDSGTCYTNHDSCLYLPEYQTV